MKKDVIASTVESPLKMMMDAVDACVFLATKGMDVKPLIVCFLFFKLKNVMLILIQNARKNYMTPEVSVQRWQPSFL